MTIGAIPALPSVPAVGQLSGAQGVAAPAGPSDGGFGSVLANAVDGLSGLQKQSDALAVKAVTGDLTDIHQATLAATRAQVTMELVSAVRNKGVDAFNEIMRMQA
jgi:flagellar hook-basal body complex protein FliE